MAGFAAERPAWSAAQRPARVPSTGPSLADRALRGSGGPPSRAQALLAMSRALLRGGRGGGVSADKNTGALVGVGLMVFS